MLDEKNKDMKKSLPENSEEQNTTSESEVEKKKKNFSFEEDDDVKEFGPYGRPYSF